MERLIIVITHRKKLGSLLIPYIVHTDDSPSITPVEQAIPALFDSSDYSFSNEEKEVIKILYNNHDKNIHKIFSKGKTLRAFYSALTNDFATKHIRPYIEKNITKALELLRYVDIPFYFKDPKYSNLYETDLVTFHREPAEALFQFNLTEDDFTYTLKIFSKEKKLLLKDQDILELTTSPAAMLINNNLYWFNNIDIKKFRPFREKSFITIPQRSIDTYMASFVKNSIQNHRVEANGFKIIDAEVEPKAYLHIDNNLAQTPVFFLKFRYNDRLFMSGTKSQVFVTFNKNGNEYVFTRLKRHKEWEESIKRFLTEDLKLKEVETSQYLPRAGYSMVNDRLFHSLITWINDNSEQLKERRIEITYNENDKIYYTGEYSLEIDIEDTEDWFDINAIVKIEGHSIPFYKFKKHLTGNIQEYLLPDGKIFIIPEEWFTKYSDIFKNAHVENKKIRLKKIFFSLLTKMSEKSGERSMSEKLGSFYDDKERKVDVPEGLKATLRPYQTDGYSWLMSLHKNRFGGILADDMGLGKTLQTISLLLKIYEDKPSGEQDGTEMPVQLNLFDTAGTAGKFNKIQIPASLIVLPTSLIHNWRNELSRFAPQLKTYIYTGSNRLKTKDIGKILKHYHIVLTTYGIVRNDINYLNRYKFHYTLLDESQYIKNPSSKTYAAVMNLNSSHRLVLTGTPIENSLSDLWAQMNFVNPELLGNYNRFKNFFIKQIVKNKNEEVERKLQLLINPFILRRTKEMVAKDLPPLTEQVIYCDMTSEQKEIYEKEKSGIRNEIFGTLNENQNNSFMVLQALTRLRQIANHPVLVDSSYEGASGKFEQVMSGLEDIVSEKHKVLVFSSFVKNLELIEGRLNERNIKYAKLTGATTNREKAIKEFTDDEECRIFLISLKAGGVGLNLVEADYVFMLNPWWNPAAEAQAINRAHRIGQTKKVFVYKFLSAETIEEKIASLQKKKQKLADTFITTENLLKNLTKEEFENLLS